MGLDDAWLLWWTYGYDGGTYLQSLDDTDSAGFKQKSLAQWVFEAVRKESTRHGHATIHPVPIPHPNPLQPFNPGVRRVQRPQLRDGRRHPVPAAAAALLLGLRALGPPRLRALRDALLLPQVPRDAQGGWVCVSALYQLLGFFSVFSLASLQLS